MIKRGIFSSNRVFSALLCSFTAGFLIMFLCFSFITPAATYATDEPSFSVGVGVDLAVESIISIRALDSTGTSPISSVTLNTVPTDTGTFTKNSFVLQVDTNNITGYELLVSSDYKTDGTTSETTPPTEAAYTNALVNYATVANNATISDTIPTLSTSITETDFSVANSAYQNMWGISSSYSETIAGESHAGGDLAFYAPVPNHNDTTTLRNDVETAAHDSRTNIGVAANINTGKLSGTYHNRLVFTAVGNPIPYKSPKTIHYDANGDNVSGSMSDQTTAYLNASEYLGVPEEQIHPENDDDGWMYAPLSSEYSFGFITYAPNFIRPGYGFVGWNTERDGSGVMFGASQFTMVLNPTLKQQLDEMEPEQREAIYAQLGSEILPPELEEKFNTDGLVLYAQWVPSAGSMQNWNGCDSMSVGDVTALTDSRVDSINPNSTYSVAKLADGKCWMTENLRYTGGGASSSTWSDVATEKQYNYTNITLADSSPRVISGGIFGPNDPTIGHEYGWYGYGSLYSWAAAINSTDAYENEEVTIVPASQSICPVGWRLPTTNDGGQTTEFDNLYTILLGDTATENSLMNVFKMGEYPNNFTFGGIFHDGFVVYRGTSGGYWTALSVDSSTAQAFVLRIGSSSGPASTSTPKVYGSSVRCVASS